MNNEKKNIPITMKKYLTPLDNMRLDAARDKDGFKPSVLKYNLMVANPKAYNYVGVPIIPIGTEGSLALI